MVEQPYEEEKKVLRSFSAFAQFSCLGVLKRLSAQFVEQTSDSTAGSLAWSTRNGPQYARVASRSSWPQSILYRSQLR